jgi:hypothetical protein
MCDPLQVAHQPEAILPFQQTILRTPLPMVAPEPGPDVPQTPFSVGCNPIAPNAIEAHAALLLEYEQRWHFQSLHFGPLSMIISLAPAETLHLIMRNTQRKQLDQSTFNQVDKLESSESTIVDRDILNIARSSSRTSGWTVAGNATFTIPKFSAGLNASATESVSEASSSSAQRVAEQTRKSATSLSVLQKIESRTTVEQTRETAAIRTIRNPYHDRSLRLNVVNVAKEYCVEFHLTKVSPVLVLTIKSLEFDRNFVLNNRSFLADYLLDQDLQAQLLQALDVVTAIHDTETTQAKAKNVAWTALTYLFTEDSNIFSMPEIDSGEDPNRPFTSFEGYRPSSGLADAADNQQAVILTTLGFYYRIFTDIVNPDPSHSLAIDLVLSLESSLTPRWLQAEEADKMSNMLDYSSYTEIFRRLGGFLTMASGILRPLLQPLIEEREAAQNAKRAEFVVQRVVDHLACYSELYTQRYLQYISDQTSMHAIRALALGILTGKYGISSDAPGYPYYKELFEPEAAFLDGNDIVVPRRKIPFRKIPFEIPGVDFERPPLGMLSREDVIAPCDGIHVEAAPGECVLPDLPR